MKGNTTKDVMPTIEYQDRQILLSVLAQFLLLGANDAAGSRAVSQDHSRLFVKALDSVAKQWEAAFQNDVINQWVDLNYSTLPNGYPKLKHSTISDEDVAETSTAIQQLVAAGMLHPDRDSENRIRRMVNLPELSEEDYENYAEDITSKKKAADELAKQMAANPQPTPTATPDGGQVTNPNNPDANMNPDNLPANSDDPTKLTATEILKNARQAQRHLMTLVGA
jgi:phage gp29-like protein